MMFLPALLAALAVQPTPVPDTTIRIARGTTVNIEGAMAGVRLRTGDGDQVTVAGARATLRGRQLEIEAGFFRGRDQGMVTVTVPRWARVEINSINGDTEVTGAPEELTVESFSGSVVVTGGTGTMSISNASGAVTVRGFAGRTLDVESISGAVLIDGATGAINVETVNERITLRNVRSSTVTVESTNGGIDWTGAFLAGGRYDFSTHNGSVTLYVPASIDARLRVSTFQGSFDTSIPATTSGNGVRHRTEDWGAEREITATYGRGSAGVTIETFNGSVRVRRQGET